MHWRHRVVLSLVVVLPAPVLAQTIKPDDLVGTWAATAKDGKAVVHDTLRFSADGELTRTYMEDGKLKETKVRDFRWSLSSDTLWTPYSTLKPFSVAQLLEEGKRLELRGGIATLNGPKDSTVYTRVDVGNP